MQKKLFVKGLKVINRSFNTRLLSTFCLPMAGSYEAAVKALNTLQSNASALQEICRSGQIRQSDRFEKGKCFASRAKVPVEELDKLSAIHVSGTKGKGSVCAFCDNILRECGYKTGFFSSPHLVEVRERIRIDGKAISKEAFAQYFWECWDNFKQDSSGEMPPYFVFLTVMSFYIFMTEKVDVAIVEVGIGGAYDTTNILRSPWVCGVTSLGYDHVAVLGGTTESIAWNKAGIFKPGVPAFTVPQDKISSRVLAQRAKELKAPLKVAPDMFSYPGKSVTTLGIEGKHQFQNASLAVQMCKAWLDRHKKKVCNTGNYSSQLARNTSEVACGSDSTDDRLIPLAKSFPINDKFKSGLEKTYWPGRSHCIKRNNYSLFLDGAHTPKSINACSAWFCQRADEEKESLTPQSVARVLIFNCTGERDPRKLLAPLVECEFDYAVFCTNSVIEESSRRSSDLSDFTTSLVAKRKRCYENHEAWKGMTGETKSGILQLKSALDLNKALKIEPNVSQSSCVFPSVTDALHWVLADREATIHVRHPNHPSLPRVISRANHVQVIVTGSLHLVGAAMKVLGSDVIGEI